MPWRSQNPTTMETVCGALSYVTFGISGLLYMLLSKSGSQSQWFRFNMFQGTFLAMLGMLAGWAIGPLVGIIFGVMGAVAPGVARAGSDLAWQVVGIFSAIYSIVLIYGCVMAFLRKSPEFPLVSPMVRQNMTRY